MNDISIKSFITNNFTEQLINMQHFHFHQHPQHSISEACPLCTGQNFAVMLNRALYDRYLSNVNMYYTDKMDFFIEEQITPETCKFREQMCDYFDQELLKREYSAHEYPAKIQMLSEYYKFHRDVPKIFQNSVFRILGKHFDRLRHFDYKKIKCVLKEQQGISLTTQKSDQSSINSDQVKKSRYSTVLYELNDNSQSESQILHNFCEKIDQAFEHVKFKNDFKGQYFSGEKKFEEYLLNSKKVNHRTSKPQFTGTNVNTKIKNYNLLHKPLSYQHLNNFALKTDRIESKKKSMKKRGPQILLQTNNTLKQNLKNFKKSKNKPQKSNEKTTANQTISRDQKSRRMDKLQKTLELEIEKNHNNIFKPFATGFIGLKSNAMLQTLQQIYKPATSSIHEKYSSDKSAKASQQQSIHNLQKIYESKLSGRKSENKLKSKVTSLHNSKEIHSNLNNKLHPLIGTHQINQQTERLSLKKKQQITTRCSSHKKLMRSKSTPKTLHSQTKTSKKALQTIDYIQNDPRPRSKSTHKKPEVETNHRLSNFLKQKQNILVSEPRLTKDFKQRNSSKKDLKSNKKQQSSSKKSLHSRQKIQKSGSRSHVTSARGVNNDKAKFHTIDPEASKNIEQYLQRKMTIGQKPKAPKAKFYN